MRVCVILSDTGACGSYRMIWPAQAVKRVRPDWHISLHPPESVIFYVHGNGSLGRINGLPPFSEIDLLVFQRVGKSAVVELMRLAQEAGTAVVMDNDDAMWCIDRRNAAWASWNDARPSGFHWKQTETAVQYADVCTVTTPLLAKRYGDGRCEVLPNVVPMIAVERTVPAYGRGRAVPVVGWPGQLKTHPGDLAVVGSGVQEAGQAAALDIAAMPEARGVAQAWGLQPEQVRKIDPVPLGQAYYDTLTEFDIGLVPLVDSRFNQGKSWLKALELSAAGASVVASPTWANRELAKHLPILLAGSPAQWREHVVRLALSPSERRERGEEARRVVLERFTFEASAEGWAQAWERALGRRRKLRGGRDARLAEVGR